MVENGMTMGICTAALLRKTTIGPQRGGLNSICLDIESRNFSYLALQRVDFVQRPAYEIMVPSSCSGSCVVEAAKGGFPEISETLAITMSKRLSYLMDVSAVLGRSGPRKIADDDPAYVPNYSPYTITLRNFSRGDVLAFIGVMVEEFPGYQHHDLISLDSSEAQYLYETSASRAKLLEWINILLNDMRLDEKDAAITFEVNDLTIERSAPTGQGTGPE